MHLLVFKSLMREVVLAVGTRFTGRYSCGEEGIIDREVDKIKWSLNRHRSCSHGGLYGDGR